MAERDDLPLSLFEDVDATDDPTTSIPAAADPNPAPPAEPAPAEETTGSMAAVGAYDEDVAGPPLTHMIAATALEAQSATGWVFRNVSFDCRPGALVAVVGPPASGRSGLLLALTGRLRPTGGSLHVAGYDACGSRRDADAIREQATLARLGTLIGPEPEFSVAMAVDERCVLEDVSLDEGRAAFADICAILELSIDHDVIIATLDPMSRTKLSVALACVAPTSLVALDDIDAGVHDIAEHRLWRSLRRLSDLGVTVVASTSDLEPAQLYPDIEVKLDPGE